MVKFDLWTRRKSLCLDKSSGGSSSCGQNLTVVADSLYSSSSSLRELDQRTTHHVASSPPYLPQPPTHSTATVAPLDLTTTTDSVSRQSETYVNNNNNNNNNNHHSQKNDNKYNSYILEEHQHGNNNANDGNNSAAVAFSQLQQHEQHTEFITDFKQITKTSSAKSSYEWKHGKITKTTTATKTVTHPVVRQDLLEPLQIQIPTVLSHHQLQEEEAIMDTPYNTLTTALGASTTSFIATTCKQQTTSKIIHSSLPPSQSVVAAIPSTSRQKATIFHHHHHHHHEQQMSSATTGLDLSTASCRRTIPITSWASSTSASMSYKHAQYLKYEGNCDGGVDKNRSGTHGASSTVTAAHLVQIKREIPDVHNTYHHNNNQNYTTAVPGLRQTAVVKFERHQNNCSSNNNNNNNNININKETTTSNLTITNNSVTIMDGTNIASGQTTIPVGIAVARQRLQETTQATSPILKPDISRYGIGLSDLTGCATPSLSQSMYFTGTNSTMLPLSDAMTMGVSTRSTPTLWQYPSATLPIEPILPSPVGYQLMRDPSTGQLVMIQPTTTIDQPFQPTVVWPQYTQAAAAYTSQPSQLMLPPQMSQALQPPPLAPLQLLGPDYLASATLHQHTQTQHTRLVALTADGKRKTANGMPLPLTSHAFVKIEDMSGGMSPHQSLFEPEKSLQSQFAAAMSGNDIPAQIFYQHPANLIQIAPQNQSTTIMESSTTDCRQVISPVHHPCLTPPPEDQQDPDEGEHQTMLPEVQDANIQTSPVMSEEENSNCTDDGMAPESTCQENEINTNTNEPEDSHNMVMSSTFLNHHNHSEDANVDSCIVSSSETSVPTIKPKVEVVTPEKCVIFPSRFTSSLHESISNSTPTSTGCDVSGLELLSRSIEVFHKKTTTTTTTTTTLPTATNIKMEPLSPQPEPSCLSPNGPNSLHLQQHQQPPPTHSELGGLNLLCALAEQRFQEEVGSDANTCKKSSPSSSSMDDYESRKRKHKHSGSKKSSKRSKRDRSDDRKRKRFNNDDDRLKNSFHRIKQKYSKCSCPDRHEDGHRCHQSNWPTTEQIISVMETEVKDRLVSMMRKREEVKREIVLAKNLKDIKTLSSDRESSATPPSLIMKPSSLSNLTSMKFSSIPALSPNFSSSSNSSTTMVEIPKVLSDTDSSKFDEQETSSSERSSKRKGGTPKRHDDSPNTETIVAKKPKSLIGYILASKDRVSDTNVKGMVYANSMEELKLKNHKQYASPSLELYTTDSSDSSYNKTKQPSAFKYEHDDDSSKPSSSAFSIFGDKTDLKKAHKRRHDKRKKTKKQMKEKRKIDARCILKPHQLDQDQLRVLTSMGGLFYAGRLSAIQAPDIYAVTLDGERGNRPHIMSREEILRDAIMEVAPRTAEELPIGTRICAYWSQQYRCLYPGTVTAPSSPDSDAEGKFVNVEFDDGDNGRIAICDIRFLLSNYPIVEYDADPLDRKGKQKRAPSTTLLEHDHILPACSNIFNATCVLNRNEVDAYREERKKLKKIHKEREREEERKHRKKYKCFDEDCKHNHKKHKKRRKHKKHHHLVKEEERSSPLADGHISPDDSVSQIGSFSQTPIKSVSEVKVPDSATKEDTEEDNGSTVTESSGSLYQPKFFKDIRKPSAQALSESSKIAAFLPARQLWTWSGKGFKRSTGRVKKQFFKAIQRGKETISVGDSAVFLSTGRPDRPYIGHIESMWETAANNMVVRVKWFYHPEETEGAPNLKYPGALFESPHEDENDVQTISHKCEVLTIDAYTNKFGNNPKKYRSIYDNNDTYYKAGFYDPTTRKIKMEEDIPVLAENEKWA